MIRVLYLIIVYNIFNNFQINNAREVTENDYDQAPGRFMWNFKTDFLSSLKMPRQLRNWIINKVSLLKESLAQPIIFNTTNLSSE